MKLRIAVRRGIAVLLEFAIVHCVVLSVARQCIQSGNYGIHLALPPSALSAMAPIDECDWLTLREVARKFGKHISTVVRWAEKGARGHKLRTAFIGGKRHVRRDDLSAFLSAINSPGLSTGQHENCRATDLESLDHDLKASGF